MKMAVDRLPYYAEQTNLAEGLETARREILGQSGDRSNVPNVVLLVTDGKADLRVNDLSTESMQLRGIADIVAVGIGSAVNTEELRAITSRSSAVLLFDQFTSLEVNLRNIINRMCPDFIFLSTTSPPVTISVSGPTTSPSPTPSRPSLPSSPSTGPTTPTTGN